MDAVGVCDSDEVKATRTASEHGIKKDCVFADTAAMLQKVGRDDALRSVRVLARA